MSIGILSSNAERNRLISRICKSQNNQSVFVFGRENDSLFFKQGVGQTVYGIFAIIRIEHCENTPQQPATVIDTIGKRILTGSQPVFKLCNSYHLKKMTLTFDPSPDMFRRYLEEFKKGLPYPEYPRQSQERRHRRSCCFLV